MCIRDSHETIWKITKIDWWFLDKMQHLANLELGLKNGPLTREKLSLIHI